MINLTRAILLALTTTLTACGTLTTIKDGGVVGLGEWNQEPQKIAIYPGVMSDVGHVLQHGEWYRIIDFPLSFAADTVLLPYTMISTITEDNNKAEQAQQLQQPQSATVSEK